MGGKCGGYQEVEVSYLKKNGPVIVRESKFANIGLKYTYLPSTYLRTHSMVLSSF
jgi:hypothetical protein